MSPLFSMAMVTGLLGSGHCLGMCGGLVAALSLGRNQNRGGPLFHLFYNLGRILTYSLLGLGAGWVGSALTVTGHFSTAGRALLIGSDLLVILLGIGTAGLWQRLNLERLEFAAPVQVVISALQPFRNSATPLVALPIGLLMGLLPCGLLYAMLLTATQSAAPASGLLVMLGFGLGTAPSLFLFGSAAHWLSQRLRSRLLQLAGFLVALTGGYHLWVHLQPWLTTS